MKIYFLRHAIALDRKRWHQSDRDRPLTEEGRQKMEVAAKGMKRLHLTFDEIWTSPFTRAYDTAQIVAKALQARKKMRVKPALASNGNPAELIDHISKRHPPFESLLMVGHEPYLSRLLTVLLGGGSKMTMELRKGGLAMIRTTKIQYGPCAELKWWIPPKILRKL